MLLHGTAAQAHAKPAQTALIRGVGFHVFFAQLIQKDFTYLLLVIRDLLAILDTMQYSPPALQDTHVQPDKRLRVTLVTTVKVEQHSA
jgi:hypothetical protein